MFYENGPFVVSEDLNILKREYSWTNAFSMLYIDNPVGAGFSFTLGREGYAENQVDIVKGLYKALQQFFRLFPEQRQNDFYIAGESYADYLNLPEVRKAIHVGKLRFDEPSVMVKYYLQDDFMQSNKVILERLLNFNIKILIYNGNLDLLVPTASQEMLLGSLNWKFSEEFKRAKREIWQNERGFIIGYKKRARNLSFISIRNAGHLVPHDEPLYAFEMIKKFVEN
ncbi:venom serine carboxypeptidase-like protein [Dinothrombium tinctorium]|uniref:Venom serine carboxypeptidase-like protein n=1 Tax=Dinothrombium tinctorium TaxID=1965070 RepID=A0A443R916_9ACAR|nr:venom serine carboxypeptidase-like protein [Dinothrombium tinctorium]